MQAFFILSTQHRADASTPERKSVSMKKKVKVISSLSLAATLIVPSAIVGFAADVETTENPTVSVVNFSPESGNKVQTSLQCQKSLNRLTSRELIL